MSDDIQLSNSGHGAGYVAQTPQPPASAHPSHPCNIPAPSQGDSLAPAVPGQGDSNCFEGFFQAIRDFFLSLYYCYFGNPSSDNPGAKPDSVPAPTTPTPAPTSEMEFLLPIEPLVRPFHYMFFSNSPYETTNLEQREKGIKWLQEKWDEFDGLDVSKKNGRNFYDFAVNCLSPTFVTDNLGHIEAVINYILESSLEPFKKAHYLAGVTYMTTAKEQASFHLFTSINILNFLDATNQVHCAICYRALQLAPCANARILLGPFATCLETHLLQNTHLSIRLKLNEMIESPSFKTLNATTRYEILTQLVMLVFAKTNLSKELLALPRQSSAGLSNSEPFLILIECLNCFFRYHKSQEKSLENSEYLEAIAEMLGVQLEGKVQKKLELLQLTYKLSFYRMYLASCGKFVDYDTVFTKTYPLLCETVARLGLND